MLIKNFIWQIKSNSFINGVKNFAFVVKSIIKLDVSYSERFKIICATLFAFIRQRKTQITIEKFLEDISNFNRENSDQNITF